VNEFLLGYTRQRRDTLLLSDAMQPGRNLEEPPARLHSITSQKTLSSQSPPLDLQTIKYRTSSFAYNYRTNKTSRAAATDKLHDLTAMPRPNGISAYKTSLWLPSPSPMTVHGKNPTKS